ncbi:MAG TPA: ATP synthase F0 subunit B, partial [Terriglobales bacterium]|nr:ATP synthase F0 subunit B [Terriglobales bacterium]
MTSSHHRLGFAVTLFLLLFCAAAFSQESAGKQKSKTSDQHSNSAQQEPTSDQATDLGSELAKESREAAGEEKNQTEQFKKSSSVMLLARITGLSLQHAYWLAVLINFGVIAAAIIWFSRSHLPGVFRNRTASIQKAMEEARKASQEANQRLADIEARLSRLDVEIGTMRAAAEKEAAEEEARIKSASEEDARKIIQSAEQEIAAAAKSARRELKAYAADLAVSMAQRQIRVDSDTD